MGLTIDKNQCTGCGSCVSLCPHKALSMTNDDELNQRRVRYAKMNDVQMCTACRICELMCTACAIQFDTGSLGSELVDMDGIPPHAGCSLGSLTRALACAISELGVSKSIVIFKKKSADVNLTVETHNYSDEQFFPDGIDFKLKNPEKLVILICSSSKPQSMAAHRKNFLALGDESVMVCHTLNCFTNSGVLDSPVHDGNFVLEELSRNSRASFIARGSVRSPVLMKKLIFYLKCALQEQLSKKSFSFVEIVFPCFYRLAGRPRELMDPDQLRTINTSFDNSITPLYKTGIFRGAPYV